MKRLVFILMLVGVVFGERAGPYIEKLFSPSKDVIKQERNDEIEAMLVAEGTGFGRPMEEQGVWAELEKREVL